MIKQRCPYRRPFDNVHIRRAFLIFGLPLVGPIALIAAAARSIKKNTPALIREIVQAFKEDN